MRSKQLYTTLFFILFLASSLPGQYKINGRILNEETGLSIPYVNIAVPELSLGTVSDKNGYFEMELDNRSRRVIMSSMAYITTDFRASDLAFGKTVYLRKETYSLPQIDISSRRLRSLPRRLGLKNRSRGPSAGFGSRQLGTEIGTIIDVPGEYLVQSAHFILNHAKGDSLLFRLNIYDYKNSQTGEKLIKEDIIINTGQTKGTIDIDLSEYNLTIRDDILMSLEWIDDDKGLGNTDISFDCKRGKRRHRGIFIKETSGADFKPMSYRKSLSLCFYLMVKEIL